MANETLNNSPPDFMPQPDDADFIDEVYSRLVIWRDGCSETHRKAREARQIIRLNDPHQDPPKTKPGEHVLQLQTLKSTFNNCVADQMDNVLEAKMLPEIPEVQKLTDDINDIVSYIFELNDYRRLHRWRVQDYLATGTAITQIMWDKEMSHGKGDVALIRVPVEQFLYDPAVDTIQGARALFKVSWHPMSWYKKHYPDKYWTIQADEHAAYAVGEQHNQSEISADEEKAMLLEYWWREYNTESHKYTINVAYLAGRTLLEKYEDLYAHGMYPFVVDVYTEIEGLPVGDGLITELAPMQRYINRYYHYIDANIRAAAKMRLLVNSGAQIDLDKISDWNEDVVTGERIDEQAVRFMTSPPFTSLPFNVILQMQSDMKMDSGQNQFTRGEGGNSITAASAITALQEAGGKMSRMRTEALKAGFKLIAEQVLWLISEFYNKDRRVLITGRETDIIVNPREVNASAERLMLKGRDIPAPPYLVRVQVQRRSPNAVADQNQIILEAYKMSAEARQDFPLSVLFSMLNIDGKDKILPAIEGAERYTEMIQQLAQQNQTLTEQVQQQAADINNLRATVNEQAKQALTRPASSADKAALGAPGGIAIA